MHLVPVNERTACRQVRAHPCRRPAMCISISPHILHLVPIHPSTYIVLPRSCSGRPSPSGTPSLDETPPARLISRGGSRDALWYRVRAGSFGRRTRGPATVSHPRCRMCLDPVPLHWQSHIHGPPIVAMVCIRRATVIHTTCVPYVSCRHHP